MARTKALALLKHNQLTGKTVVKMLNDNLNATGSTAGLAAPFCSKVTLNKTTPV